MEEEGLTTWQKLQGLSKVDKDTSNLHDFMLEAMGWTVNYKSVTVRMLDGSAITGKVNIRSFARLTDFLNAADDEFVAVVPDGDDRTTVVAMLNKSRIVCVETGD